MLIFTICKELDLTTVKGFALLSSTTTTRLKAPFSLPFSFHQNTHQPNPPPAARENILFSRLTEQGESDSPVDDTLEQKQINDDDSASTVVNKNTNTNNVNHDSSDESMNTEQLMAAIGTSPRRIILSFLSASAIALGANFLGVTSHILEALPEHAVETTGLDTFYPRGKKQLTR